MIGIHPSVLLWSPSPAGDDDESVSGVVFSTPIGFVYLHTTTMVTASIYILYFPGFFVCFITYYCLLVYRYYYFPIITLY